MPPSATPQPKKISFKKRKWLRLYFLHRYTGLLVTLFAVILSLTGIMLNHTEALGLHDKHLNTPWLMSLYGIQTPVATNSYQVFKNPQPQWVTQLGDDLFLGKQALQCSAPLTGAIATGELLIISNETQLCLFTPNGELIDHVPIDASVRIEKLGFSNESNEKSIAHKIAISTTKGIYRPNIDFTEVTLEPDSDTRFVWLTPQTPPKILQTQLSQYYQGDGLPLERIILDLHSGRLVGMAGVYFMDMIAVFIIFLAITGVIMWAKRSISRKKKNIK